VHYESVRAFFLLFFLSVRGSIYGERRAASKKGARRQNSSKILAIKTISNEREVRKIRDAADRSCGGKNEATWPPWPRADRSRFNI
jgi:hypothetical protein